MSAVTLRSRSSRALSRLYGVRKAGFPKFIEPCDPSLRNEPPQSAGWRWEIKADGYRAQLHLNRGEVTVFSRTGLDWTTQFSSIAMAARALDAKAAVIDGEAVSTLESTSNGTLSWRPRCG
ncbi:MAG: hypothetical protein JOZ58_23390 [Acetobacteraceae bacterium]|nr:hypothetical protein [Acetobacteraceae bacterium]